MSAGRTLRFLPALLLAGACAAPDSDRPPELPLPVLECACGEVEADAFGCPAPECRAGRGERSNPRCACAPWESGPVRLSDGTLLSGEVVKNAGGTLDVLTPDGESRAVALAELDPLTAYRLAWADTARADAAGQLELAALAGELGLFARARRHLALAEAAAPASAPRVEVLRAELDVARAARLLAAAEEARADGREREADRLYAAVITTQPTSAQALVAAEVLALAAAAGGAAREARQADWTAAQAEALSPAVAELELTREYAHRGLMSGGSPLRAIASFEAALRHGREAAGELETVLEQAPAGEALAVTAGELRADLRELRVATCSWLAEVATGIGAYETARLAALRARDLEPDDEAARRLHARVALAAEEAGWSSR